MGRDEKYWRPLEEFLDLMGRATDADVKARLAKLIDRRPGIVAEVWRYHWGDRWGLIPHATWLWAFRAAGYTDTFRPAEPPDGPILLFRGCPHQRRFGMAWSPLYEQAEAYAGRECGVGKRHCGNIYEHWAWSHELLARIYGRNWHGDNGVYEEYVLDPRYLDDDNTYPHVVDALNFADEYARCVMSGRPTNFGLLAPPNSI